MDLTWELKMSEFHLDFGFLVLLIGIYVSVIINNRVRKLEEDVEDLLFLVEELIDSEE